MYTNTSSIMLQPKLCNTKVRIILCCALANRSVLNYTILNNTQHDKETAKAVHMCGRLTIKKYKYSPRINILFFTPQ